MYYVRHDVGERMTLIQTEERCPECGQTIYMVVWPKKRNALEHIVINYQGTKHGIADSIYVDKQGMLWTTKFDDDSELPNYHCIHCEWFA